VLLADSVVTAISGDRNGVRASTRFVKPSRDSRENTTNVDPRRGPRLLRTGCRALAFYTKLDERKSLRTERDVTSRVEKYNGFIENAVCAILVLHTFVRSFSF